MILFFYNLALLTVLLAALPGGCGGWPPRRNIARGWPSGWGEFRQHVRGAKAVGKPVIWLHAVSVGEVLAVSRLVRRSRPALPGYRLLVSTTTRTGQALARERFGADRVFYCPLDLPWAVRAYLNALRAAAC